MSTYKYYKSITIIYLFNYHTTPNHSSNPTTYLLYQPYQSYPPQEASMNWAKISSS